MNEEEVKALWQSQPLQAETVSLETIRAMAEGFHAAILRRNRQEAIAACLVMLFFGAFAWTQQNTTMRTGCILMVLGTLVMLHQLRKRAALDRLSTQDLAATHVACFRAALVRQRDAARTVWRWGIAPAVPGIAVLMWGMAENDPFAFPWLPMLALFAVPCAVVCWMNVKVARAMRRQIDALDASAGDVKKPPAGGSLGE